MYCESTTRRSSSFQRESALWEKSTAAPDIQKFFHASVKKAYKPIEISEEGLELIEFLSLDCTAAEGEWHSDSEIKIDKNGYVIRNGEKTKEFWDGTICSEKMPLRLKIRNICGDETVWEV